MKSATLAKFAASTLIVSLSCGAASETNRAPADAQQVRAAGKAAQRAAKAIEKQDFAGAIGFAETAVAGSPRDAGYRALLGQAYLGAGRFASARTSFADALALSPDDGHAALNLVLSEIALGDKPAAQATLADYRDKLQPSDYGLALALAGKVDDAVAALEAAVRAGGADAKTRQNLGLAYAMQGKWMNAKVMAVQDLSPTDADARVIQWMSFVRPTGAADQVASLLGVTPAAADAGQPTRLALATPEGAPVRTAAAAPAPSAPAQPVAVAMAPAPVDSPPGSFEVPASVVAQAAAEEAPAPAAAVAPAPVAAVAEAIAAAPRIVFAALKEIVQPLPVIRAPAAPAKQAIVPSPRATQTAAAARTRTVEAGRFVVQIGAFDNAAVAQNSWKRQATRLGLAGFEPASSQVRVRDASFTRLSVGGFATRAEALNICVRVRARGGDCFVRSVAGDATAEWVRRGQPTRLAAR